MFDKFSEIFTPDDYEEGKTIPIRKRVDHINETVAIIRRLMQYGNNVSEKMGPIMKRVMPRITDILLTIDLPSDCLASLARIMQAAKDGEYWAIRFLDTISMPGSGQLKGIIPHIGQYDQCIHIQSPVIEDKPVIFGRYCMVMPVFPLPPRMSYNREQPIDDYLEVSLSKMLGQSNKSDKQSFFGQFYGSDGQFKLPPNVIETTLDMNEKFKKIGFQTIGFGLCLPSTCHIKDVENAINKFSYPMTRIPFELNDGACDYKDKPIKIDKYQLIALSTYSVLLFLVILSTIYDIIRKYCVILKPTLITNSFSLINNWKLLIPKKCAKQEINRFSSLDGMRALLTIWVFTNHLWLFNTISVFTSKGMFTAMNTFLSETRYILFRHLFITQIFILIAGMFTSYVMIINLEENRGKFNYFQYILYRYFRTIPALVGTIFIIYILPLTGDGPLWKGYLDGFLQSCKYNWNASVLMISNYKFELPDRIICNPPTWYTSVDFQAFALAPFIFLFLYHKPRFGLILNISIIVLSCFVQIAPKLIFNIAHYHETAAFQNVDDGFKSVVHHFYGLEQHIGVYSLGILLGYIIRHKPDIYLGGRIGETVIWIVSSVITILSFVWHRNYFKFDTHITDAELLLYGAFAKYMSVSVWVWMLYACCTGRGGYVNKFLSLRAFKYLQAISFEVYLVHSIPILYRVSSMREQVIVRDYYLLSLIPYDFIMVCSLALILNLLVTSPFRQLIDSFLKPSKSSKKTAYNLNNEKHEQNNNNELVLTTVGHNIIKPINEQ